MFRRKKITLKSRNHSLAMRTIMLLKLMEKSEGSERDGSKRRERRERAINGKEETTETNQKKILLS
jgi:hypothetical protein